MLIDQLATALGLCGTTARTYTILNQNGAGLYLEGQIKILNFTPQKIDLDISRAPISVVGENLKIYDLNSSSVIIKGEIFGYYHRHKIKTDLKAN